jgi:hypothetical protein
MKNLLIFLVLAFSINASAQTFTASKGGGFDVNTGTPVSNIVVGDKTFDTFTTTGGSEYIKCNSPKTGNDYAVWVGKPTEHVFEGNNVRVSKKGTFFIIILSKNTGNPYNKYLKSN